MSTRAPSATNLRVTASPMPRAPPVTSATLPATRPAPGRTPQASVRGVVKMPPRPEWISIHSAPSFPATHE